MTAVVGILCPDGAVVGTDSSVTMGDGATYRTIELPTEKLAVVDDRVIIAGTGSVGHGQRFRNIVDEASRAKFFTPERDGKTRTTVDICRDISKATIADFAETRSNGNVYGALLAVWVKDRPVLCEFSVVGFQPTLCTDTMWFCSMGSAQPITDPFLALIGGIFWPKGQPTVSHAVLAATWALDHAIAVNPGGVNGPVRIAVLEKRPGKKRPDCVVRTLSNEDMEAHRAWIAEAKRALADSLPAAESAREIPRLS